MDKSTPIGFILGFGFVIGAIMLSGQLMAFVDVPGFCVTVGGAFGALMVAMPLSTIIGLPGIMMHVFFVRVPEPTAEIRRLTEYAGLVRRDGPLALEAKLDEVPDQFLRRGIEMVIDNASREKLEEALGIEMHSQSERHAAGKRAFEQLGAFAPAFGMVGTLIGLIMMLGSLDDPSKIGSGMAVAMITTFYGALLSNLVFLPMAVKLDCRSKAELQVREIMLQGLVGMIEGESPRALEARLKAFLAPKARRVINTDTQATA